MGLFEGAAQTFLISRTLAQLANILADYDPAESLRAIGRSLSLIQDSNPRLVVYLEILRMNCLVTMGAPHEALIRLNERKGLHEQFREPYIQLRRRYTAGRILEHLGRHKRAEILLQEVIAGDLEHGLVKDFFLDLVYLLASIFGGEPRLRLSLFAAVLVKSYPYWMTRKGAEHPHANKCGWYGAI